jgi:protein TonB
MAPILKDADTPSAPVSNTAPLAKSPTETPSRPQPVAIEIPVTINGARTIEGSDKREPFSETSQTVLVFSHGAVVRVATPLSPGQLIFLTNEKSKKEVVCQVVKCKGSGTGTAYVELQFTEPAPAFWGLRVPGTPAAPTAPAPTSRPAAPAIPKAIPSAPPAAAQPVIEKPVAPALTVVPSTKPVVTPPPPPVEDAKPSLSEALLPAVPAVPVSVLPAPAASSPEPPPAQNQSPAPESAPESKIPAPPLHDYSKEIEVLFAVPQAPANEATPPASEEKPALLAPEPSSEELKLQAARLQSQLGSMLFGQAPASLLEPPVTPALGEALSFGGALQQPAEITHDEPAAITHDEPAATAEETKPVPPPRKPITPALSADEEMKIPAWLAPLSQSSESSAVREATPIDNSPEAPAETYSASEKSRTEVAETPTRSQAAVFGGQLLGESAAQQDQATSSGSRKGLFIGIAAALILGVAAGAWYFQQTHTVNATPVSPRSESTSAPAETSSTSSLAAAKPQPSPTLTESRTSNLSSPTSLQPLKSATPVSTPAPMAPVPQPKNENSASSNTAPAEPPKKTPLQVHLASPVVKTGAESQPNGESLPTIDTSVSSSGAGALAAAGSQPKEPSAPVPVGGDVKPAQLIKSVPPVYPLVAKTQHVSGNVQIDALIDESGNVSSVKVISGPPLLHRAALDAVKQWKYSPAMLDGNPTSTHLAVTVQFRAQ